MTHSLTKLQAQLMNLVAHAEHNPNNGSRPTCAADVATWLWADELAKNMGISEKAVGGVITSLTEAGLVNVNIVTAKQRKMGDDSSISFTDAGFAAFEKAFPINAPKKTTARKDTTKYDYPTGLTDAQKKAFRAKARRAK